MSSALSGSNAEPPAPQEPKVNGDSGVQHCRPRANSGPCCTVFLGSDAKVSDATPVFAWDARYYTSYFALPNPQLPQPCLKGVFPNYEAPPCADPKRTAVPCDGAASMSMQDSVNVWRDREGWNLVVSRLAKLQKQQCKNGAADPPVPANGMLPCVQNEAGETAVKAATTENTGASPPPAERKAPGESSSSLDQGYSPAVAANARASVLEMARRVVVEERQQQQLRNPPDNVAASLNDHNPLVVYYMEQLRACEEINEKAKRRYNESLAKLQQSHDEQASRLEAMRQELNEAANTCQNQQNQLQLERENAARMIAVCTELESSSTEKDEKIRSLQDQLRQLDTVRGQQEAQIKQLQRAKENSPVQGNSPGPKAGTPPQSDLAQRYEALLATSAADAKRLQDQLNGEKEKLGDHAKRWSQRIRELEGEINNLKQQLKEASSALAAEKAKNVAGGGATGQADRQPRVFVGEFAARQPEHEFRASFARRGEGQRADPLLRDFSAHAVVRTRGSRALHCRSR